MSEKGSIGKSDSLLVLRLLLIVQLLKTKLVIFMSRLAFCFILCSVIVIIIIIFWLINGNIAFAACSVSFLSLLICF